ncbi:hypothetical protein C900_00420 [Fulvivirga imtechensis AK7]|uniref:Uncharacterized protein n=1 Tax=Fulvivirga imtechensis AK7 TaxID=1237149 RepID=L8JJH1_9BACT|nr:hypothetical protein C900_00420 [Fulvivirga imtechensis AK7]
MANRPNTNTTKNKYLNFFMSLKIFVEELAAGVLLEWQ